MRPLIVLALLVVPCSAAVGQGKGKSKIPLPMTQWGLMPLENEFSLEAKSITFNGKDEFKILFTFVGSSNIDRLRKALDPDEKKREVSFLFYLFDHERVVLMKVPPASVEGELTGVEKDSFRMIVRVPEAKLPEIARVEVRLEKK